MTVFEEKNIFCFFMTSFWLFQAFLKISHYAGAHLLVSTVAFGVGSPPQNFPEISVPTQKSPHPT